MDFKESVKQLVANSGILIKPRSWVGPYGIGLKRVDGAECGTLVEVDICGNVTGPLKITTDEVLGEWITFNKSQSFVENKFGPPQFVPHKKNKKREQRRPREFADNDSY